MFQSLSRDSGHLNDGERYGDGAPTEEFQSLSRDSGHLNPFWLWLVNLRLQEFQSLSRDSGHLNPTAPSSVTPPAPTVSIPQSGFGAFELASILAGV